MSKLIVLSAGWTFFLFYWCRTRRNTNHWSCL